MEPSSCPLVPIDTHERFADAAAALRAAGYRYDFETGHWRHATRPPAHIRRIHTLDGTGRQVRHYLIAYTAAAPAPSH